MNQKIIFFILPLMFVIFALSCGEEEDVKLSEAKLLSFVLQEFPNVTIDYDTVNNQITVTLPAGSSLVALTPTITLSSGATVSPPSGELQDFSSAVTYTVTAEDGTQEKYTLIIKTASASDSDPSGADLSIISFQLQGLSPVSVGVIDSEAKTVTLNVSSGTDVTQLVPTILLSEGFSILPKSGEAQDFSSPVPYVVTKPDGSLETYAVKLTIEGVLGSPSQSSVSTINDFRFSGIYSFPLVGEVDNTSQKITFRVPTSTDLTAMVPTISLSGNDQLMPASGTPQNFTNNVVYTVTASSGEKREYTVEVRFATTYKENEGFKRPLDPSLKSFADQLFYFPENPSELSDAQKNKILDKDNFWPIKIKEFQLKENIDEPGQKETPTQEDIEYTTKEFEKIDTTLTWLMYVVHTRSFIDSLRNRAYIDRQPALLVYEDFTRSDSSYIVSPWEVALVCRSIGSKVPYGIVFKKGKYNTAMTAHVASVDRHFDIERQVNTGVDVDIVSHGFSNVKDQITVPWNWMREDRDFSKATFFHEILHNQGYNHIKSDLEDILIQNGYSRIKNGILRSMIDVNYGVQALIDDFSRTRPEIWKGLQDGTIPVRRFSTDKVRATITDLRTS